jgi:membrane protein
MNYLQPLWVFIRLMARNYGEDGCQSTAAALTYQTLFAVVPLLTITYTVLASFEAFSGMGEMLQNFLFANVVPENVAVVEGYLTEFSDQARSLSLPSLLVLAVTAFLMMFTIERAFNEIWRVREPRQGFQRLLMYWAILTLGPPLVGAGLAITTYLFSLPLFSDVATTPVLLGLLPVMLNVMVFTGMYLAIPNCFVPLRHAAVGGLVTAMLFELVKRLFGNVMAQTDMEVIYGTYTAVPLFLLWIYLSWSVVLFGAELTKGLGLYRSHSSRKLESPLLQMLLILEVFFRCHQQGEVVTERKVAALGHRVNMQSWHDYKSQLLELGLIRNVDRGGLVLSKDLNELSLWDLYQSLPFSLPEAFVSADEGWESVLNQKLNRMFDDGQGVLQIDLEKLYRGESG